MKQNISSFMSQVLMDIKILGLLSKGDNESNSNKLDTIFKILIVMFKIQSLYLCFYII